MQKRKCSNRSNLWQNTKFHDEIKWQNEESEEVNEKKVN